MIIATYREQVKMDKIWNITKIKPLNQYLNTY